MSSFKVIPDVIRSVVDRTSALLYQDLIIWDDKFTGIAFEYGHINDIRERLATRMRAGENPMPLVALIEDFRLRKGIQPGLTGITDMKIIILYYSTQSMTRQEREEKVFQPFLYPVYNGFLKGLKDCGSFMISDVTLIKHDMICRPHWGDPALYGNADYPLTGVFDGIEIANLELKTYLQICSEKSINNLQ